MEEKEKEIQKLKKNLNDVTQKSKDLFKRIRARDTIITKYKNKYKDPPLESEIEKMKRNEQIGISQDDTDIINKLKEEHVKEIETLNNKIEQYEKDFEASKNKIEQYESEIESLKNKNKEYEKEIDDSKNRNEQYENEIEPLKNKNKEYEKEVETSKEKIEQYKNDIESLKNKNKEYEKEIENSKDKIEQYENDIESLKNKNKQFEKEINDKQELLEKEIKDKENKDKLILEKEKEIKNITEQLKKAQNDNNNKSVENEEMLKSELENQKNRIQSYEQDISKKEEEISNLKKLLEQSNDKINKKDDILKSYEAEIKKQKSSIEKLQREKDNFENKINEMNNNINNNLKAKEVQEEQFNPNKIKEEIDKNLKAHYEIEVINKMKEIDKLLNDKLKENFNKIEKQYLMKYNRKEEQMNLVYKQNDQKINELKEYVTNLKGEEGKNNHNINKCLTVHKGIKCQKCFQEPIIGYRYKCSVCHDYNLCQICEEKNSISGDHQHDFIKMRKEPKSNDLTIINNNINNKEIFHKNQNINKNIENDEYSYECINILQLSLYLYEGTEEGKIEIILKNNGKKAWPEGKAKLYFERESQLTGDEVMLKPQKPGEQEKYDIVLKGLEIYTPKQYKSFMGFYIDDEKFGEQLTLTINIKEKNKIKKELEDNMDKINEFRNTFDLNAEDYSDEKLLKVLKENNFNYEEAFSQLYDDNN